MEPEKIISIIDPFFERSALASKTPDQLTEIFEKLNGSLYSYSHEDYAPEKIIPLLSKKFKDLKRKEEELTRRERALKQREAELGLSSAAKTRTFPFYDAPTNSSFVTPRNTPKRTDADYVRPPDKPVRMRLIDDEPEDEAMRIALDNSREQYRIDQLRRALIQSEEDERRREEESYRAKIERDRLALEEERLERERLEADLRAHRIQQEEEDNALAETLKSASVQVKREESTDDIVIDMSRFQDKPSDISEDFLRDICVMLKNQEFENVRAKMKELSAGSIAWFIRLKCGSSTLKSKIVSKDAEAYKCILCREV